jgi:hypothetical protein
MSFQTWNGSGEWFNVPGNLTVRELETIEKKV